MNACSRSAYSCDLGLSAKSTARRYRDAGAGCASPHDRGKVASVVSVSEVQLPDADLPDGDEPAVTSARLRAIPGVVLDPQPKVFDSAQQLLDQQHAAAGVLFRAWHRFVFARATLLAAGTTYFLFLSLISLAALGYGIAALLGADQVAVWLTEALDNAFPGLIGPGGISPESIRGYGTTASIGGLIVMGFAGTSSVNAANQSLHVLYGAPKDPRNIVLLRLKMLVQLALLGPLILLSFIPAVLITALAEPLREALDVDDTISANLLVIVSVLVALGLNYLVLRFMLGRLGGIRPPQRALRIGAGVGAALIEILKYAMTSIIAWSVGKPEYGAFAVPITFLLVLYLLALALYGIGALTAAIAIKQRDELLEAAGLGQGGDSRSVEPNG
jgi:membrane protein